jgi:YidC/Oxa1 family membrane protein insertase
MASASTPASSGLSDTVPQVSAPAAGQASAAVPAAAAADVAKAKSLSDAPRIHVRTDVLDLDISTLGGTVMRADLLAYPKVKGGSERVRLMNPGPVHQYVLDTGLTGPPGEPRPTHLTPYTSKQGEYLLGNAQELRVPITWSDGNGVDVTKTYVFRRGQYRIDVEYEVVNHGASDWSAAPYVVIERNDPPTKRSMFDVESYAFHGPAFYDGSKYKKLDIKDADERPAKTPLTNGWVAALQHHFVGAAVPEKDVGYQYALNTDGADYQLSATAAAFETVKAGQVGRFSTVLFVGPKLQAQLEQAGPRLELVADYGKLTILAKPLFLLLGKVHSLFGNWGWAIIFVTFLLKLLFYPLSEASGRSMAKMKLLSPRIKNLQETYKDDREKLGRAMMELYQREKINPVAGCLPIIIQIPVFLAFYWVLLESVEMRQAPFMGWINDLSSRDPYFILPAIMAAAMFAQYKLNPTPPDPVQAKVFMIMPLVMSFTFAFFPAGLVLYWVTNTVLSIAQQWNINRRIEAAKRS